MKSMLLQYSHTSVTEHFLGSLPHVENIQWRWASNAVCPPCFVQGLYLRASAHTHVPDRVARCMLPVAFTRLFQGNFLALKTRATVTVMLRCRSAVDKTLEMLPQNIHRSSTFSYMKISKGRRVRGTEAVKGPSCQEPSVSAGNYTGTL